MVPILLLLSALPYAVAAPAVSASAFVGATSSAIFPPPGATIESYASLFPDAAQVGFPGPTPSEIRFEFTATLWS